jgi:hypothetical protein
LALSSRDSLPADNLASIVAPSSTLPDLAVDPLKFPRSVSRLDEEDEDDWNRTLRPIALEPSPRVGHSRESSLEKLQAGAFGPTAVGQQPGSSISPRIQQPPTSRSGLGSVIERVVDPKSAAYGHHRQTSIVHGIQHSRNGSLASAASSPLSPQMIAAAGAGSAFGPDRSDMHSFARLEADSGIASRPATARSGTTLASAPVVPERTSSAADGASHPPTHRNLDRRHSGRTRRDHSHHHSHSSRHKDAEKTVGEYALHVLFTSVRLRALWHNP